MNKSETFSYLELSTILEKWNHPQLQELTGTHSGNELRMSNLRLIFPDIFNGEKTPSSYQYLQNHFTFDATQLSRFLHGNVRNKCDINQLSNVTFCDTLKEQLFSSDYITYLSNVEDAENITPRDSMINNIRHLAGTTQPPLDNNHPIFTEIPLTSENTFDTDLLTSIKILLNKNTVNSLSYAIFLLILLSIYQKRIIEFKEFYTNKNIEHAIDDSLYKDFLSYNDIYKNKAFVPFTDPKYMHKYYVYVYKSTYDELYSEATLEMEALDAESSFAKLIFDYEDKTPSGNNKIIQKKYTGTPIFSTLEDMVHIVFTNPFGRIAFLCFKYTHFNHSNMFYRTGFIVSTRYRTPTVRRIIISSKKFNEQDLEYAKGILKMTNNDIILNESMLENFLTQYDKNSWMEQFKSAILPYIRSHEIKYYHLSADELAAYPLANLSDEERIEIIEALKSFSIFPNYLDSNVPNKLHRIILD